MDEGNTVDYETLKKVLASLEDEKVEYAVFGAIAVNLHGLPRATEDLDIFIAPTEANVARLRMALRSVFDDPCVDDITAEDLLGDYPSVRYAPPEGDFYMDILTRLGELYRYEDIETVRVPFDDLEVTVATPQMLHQMKKGTVRPKDWGDAARLQERFGLEESD
ncbi:MAG: nucleotidyl transferase AbiEii/AbiGii toxin family protein [Acidobacteriota bacterium]